MRGCFTMGLILLITALMFVANGVVFGMIYAQLSKTGPLWLRQEKVGQILMFVGPLVLLVGQLWLFDLVSGWVSRLSRRRA